MTGSCQAGQLLLHLEGWPLGLQGCLVRDARERKARWVCPSGTELPFMSLGASAHPSGRGALYAPTLTPSPAHHPVVAGAVSTVLGRREDTTGGGR